MISNFEIFKYFFFFYRLFKLGLLISKKTFFFLNWKILGSKIFDFVGND